MSKLYDIIRCADRAQEMAKEMKEQALPCYSIEINPNHGPSNCQVRVLLREDAWIELFNKAGANIKGVEASAVNDRVHVSIVYGWINFVAILEPELATKMGFKWEVESDESELAVE